MDEYNSLQELTGEVSGTLLFCNCETITADWSQIEGLPYIKDGVLYATGESFLAKSFYAPAYFKSSGTFKAWEIFDHEKHYICTVVVREYLNSGGQ